MMSQDRIPASQILYYLSRAMRIYCNHGLGTVKERKREGNVLTVVFETVRVRIDWKKEDEFSVDIEDRGGKTVLDFHAFKAGSIEKNEPLIFHIQAAEERAKLRGLDL